MLIGNKFVCNCEDESLAELNKTNKKQVHIIYKDTKINGGKNEVKLKSVSNIIMMKNIIRFEWFEYEYNVDGWNENTSEAKRIVKYFALNINDIIKMEIN